MTYCMPAVTVYVKYCSMVALVIVDFAFFNRTSCTTL